MKPEYDFSKGKRGRILAPEPDVPGKIRITIRIDEDILDEFFHEAQLSGGSVGYQTLINNALRLHIEGKAPKLEETLRRILREELKPENTEREATPALRAEASPVQPAG